MGPLKPVYMGISYTMLTAKLINPELCMEIKVTLPTLADFNK